MAPQTPEAAELDAQDQAETFDETHLSEDAAEFVTLEEMDDVFDSTSALGDSRDVQALDADELDPGALDDEDLETDEDLDDNLDDDLEDRAEDDDIDDEDIDEEDAVAELEPDEADIETVDNLDAVTDPDDEEVDEYESETLSDDELKDLGYQDKDEEGSGGKTPEDAPEEADKHQEDLLDEGVEETFPASDPVSVKRIT